MNTGRTLLISLLTNIDFDEDNFFLSFNYNSEAGIVLSDVFGITISTERLLLGDADDAEPLVFEATIDNVLETFFAVDVDIINNNEVLFSCRDVIFSCVDENNPLIEEILVLASDGGPIERSSASVVNFEYGINNAIPHSKGGELLCPGNIIPEGIVLLRPENSGEESGGFIGYVGLNNGNARGSFDSMFFPGVAFSEDQNQ